MNTYVRHARRSPMHVPDDARVLRHSRGPRGQSAVLPGDLELVQVGVEVR